MQDIKPSHYLAGASWFFVFVSALSLLGRKIPSDLTSWGLMALFLVIAVLASAVASSDRKI